MTPQWVAGNVGEKKPILEESEKLQNVQAEVVKHHYVRAQLREINTRKSDGLIYAAVKTLQYSLSQGPNYTWDDLVQRYIDMTKRLQEADLTINFRAEGFFREPNNSTSYGQMYERAVEDEQIRLTEKLGDLNPVRTRVLADEHALFQDHMAGGQFEGMRRVMDSPLNRVSLEKGTAVFEVSNPFFNPKSREVFAALNYGRRPHGATTKYGKSYFVLNPKFKTNAIYFAGDTFDYDTLRVSANDQISYGLLGAIYAKAPLRLRQDLYRSCIWNQRLEDTEDGETLLEAHLFEKLSFPGNLQKIYLSRGEMERDLWHTVLGNAKAFAKANGTKVKEIA